MKQSGIHYYFIGLVGLVVIAACSSDKTKVADDSAVTPVRVSTLPEPGSLQGDTISISGKYVLFFGPELKAGQPDKMDPAVLESFKQTAGAMIDSLKVVPGLRASFTTANYFRIYGAAGNAMILSKSAIENETGVLVSDGNQPPGIKKGILKPAEYHELFRDYFFLK